MKRILLMILVLGSWMGLSACGGDDDGETNIDAKQIELETILTTGGYHMVLQGPATAFNFARLDINEKFDLELDVYQLYVGEKDGFDDVYMVIFWELDEAITYEDAYIANPELEDRYVHREANIVIVTYSEDAIDLLK